MFEASEVFMSRQFQADLSSLVYNQEALKIMEKVDLIRAKNISLDCLVSFMIKLKV